MTPSKFTDWDKGNSNMSEKRQFMKFNPAAWVIHTHPLSLAAKGAWIDLLCIMWNAQNRGVLTMSIEGYARVIGATVKQTGRVVAELIESKICENFTEPDGRVTLISRRMVADEEICRRRAAGGQFGGNPNLVKSKVNLALHHKVNLPANLASLIGNPDDPSRQQGASLL